jgi:16S rRNA (uracil1498-N3)-methyltransferase
MEVYYCPPSRIHDGIAVVDGEEFHHLARVMRHEVGSELHIADGEGTMYCARIDILRQSEAECALSETLAGYNEPRVRSTLVFSLLKNPGRMDWLIEKATELGVCRIVPVVTQRTLARSAKVKRWRDLALAAMKQSCRCRLPGIEEPREFSDAFDLLADHNVFLFHEASSPAEGALILSQESDPGTLALCIGPEGGFTQEEVEYAVQRGAVVRSLGLRRLRSETAALAALARMIE